MRHSVFIDAWLLWLRPHPLLAMPWNPLLYRWMEWCVPRTEISASDVVPRALYLEVLETKEGLRTRLEEAEATIQQLRRATETQGNEMVNAWETAVNLWQIAIQTNFKAQSESVGRWTEFAVNNDGEEEQP